MKHKGLKLFLPLALIVTALAGCKPDNRTKVVFWHTMGKDLQAVLNDIIKAFMAENPDIKIEHSQNGDYDDLYDKITSAIPAGTTPTMAYCYPDHVADYNTSKACIDLTTYINDPELGFSEADGLESDFIKAYWEEGQQYLDEGIYSVPHAKSTELMFYNKKVFDKKGWTVPTTWEELEEFCEMVMEDPDYKGKEDFSVFGYDSDANCFITLSEQYGIPYTSLNKQESKGQIDFNNKAAKNMVTKLQGWYDKHYMITQGTNGGGYTSTLFIDGNLLMSIGSSGGTQHNWTENFEIGIAELPIPSADPEKRFDFFKDTGVTPLEGANNDHIIMQGPSICFFKKGTDEQKIAAWKFYKFMEKTMNTAQFAIKSGYSPVRQSSFDSEAMIDYLNKPQSGKPGLIQRAVAKYELLIDRYYVSPAFPGSSTARQAVDGILPNVFQGTKTLDKAFADAYTTANFALK